MKIRLKFVYRRGGFDSYRGMPGASAAAAWRVEHIAVLALTVDAPPRLSPLCYKRKQCILFCAIRVHIMLMMTMHTRSSIPKNARETPRRDKKQSPLVFSER